MKEGDRIVWAVNRKKIRSGTVTKIGKGPDEGLIFVAGPHKVIYTLQGREIIEINGETVGEQP